MFVQPFAQPWRWEECLCRMPLSDVHSDCQVTYLPHKHGCIHATPHHLEGEALQALWRLKSTEHLSMSIDSGSQD